MKQKIANKNFLTKDELTDILQVYPTKQDLKDVLQDYPTKQNLKKEISALEIRTDIKMEQMELRIDDKARKYRDDVLTVMDNLAKNLKNLVQEQIMANARADRALDRIENHEARITRLESHH